MPELPEVETVRRGLEPVMTGGVIARADIRRPDLRWPFPENMAQRLTSATVLRLRRRSKYILCDLDTGETLLIHLGMSGRMITHLGPEPLGNGFDSDYLTSKLQGKKSPIKSALLDQRIVSGLGNIYVCESLWRAGISPKRLSGNVSRAKIEILTPIIRDVLNQAIAAGGASLKDHRQTNGDLGYFQHSFAAYGREGEQCRTPDCTGSIKRIVQAGRSTFFCAKCQT